MTKKHYIVIAKVLYHWRHNIGTADIARQLAEAFKSDNSKFDVERFLKACGVSS